MLRFVLALTAVIATTTTPVHATEFNWTDEAQASPSGQISGTSMTKTLPNGYALTGIQMREKTDDPIYFQILGTRLCNDGANDCSDTVTSRAFRLRGQDGNIGSTKNLSVGQFRYVTQLQVCMNGRGGSNAKIKGIRFWAGELDSDGGVRTVGSPVSVTRTNCNNDWAERVRCPANKVVVGLRIHHTDNSGANAIRPVCARPVGSGGGNSMIQIVPGN